MKLKSKVNPKGDEHGEGRVRHTDFVNGAIGYRIRAGGREPLLRALGKRQSGDVLADATAGLGRDAFVAAASGFDVVLIEQVPEVFDALAESLERARAHPKTAAIVARMRVVLGDSRQLLPGLQPDLALVDPMHPPRRKSARVKADIHQLQQIVGYEDNAAQLLNAALASARRRVVFKWPATAPLPADMPKPNFEIPGKTVRFAVYSCGIPPAAVRRATAAGA